MSEAETAITPRERVAVPMADAKHIKRGVDALAQSGIVVQLLCFECKARLIYEANANGYDLLCDCKRRVIHRGV